MHSYSNLQASDFQYRQSNELDTKANVMPEIGILDRLGVVIRQPFDGLGAANFILSCVTAFYDEYQKENEDFYAYPDYFTFQSDGRLVDYRWFEIWPNHKNVETKQDAEAMLRAINDRGVNLLLIPDGPTSKPEIDEVTRESAERRIDACYLYAPNGTLDGSEFTVQQPREPASKWIQKTLEIADDKPELQGCREREWYNPIKSDIITQEFRRIDIDEAICHLPDSE